MDQNSAVVQDTGGLFQSPLAAVRPTGHASARGRESSPISPLPTGPPRQHTVNKGLQPYCGAALSTYMGAGDGQEAVPAEPP